LKKTSWNEKDVESNTISTEMDCYKEYRKKGENGYCYKEYRKKGEEGEVRRKGSISRRKIKRK